MYTPWIWWSVKLLILIDFGSIIRCRDYPTQTDGTQWITINQTTLNTSNTWAAWSLFTLHTSLLTVSRSAVPVFPLHSNWNWQKHFDCMKKAYAENRFHLNLHDWIIYLSRLMGGFFVPAIYLWVTTWDTNWDTEDFLGLSLSLPAGMIQNRD